MVCPPCTHTRVSCFAPLRCSVRHHTTIRPHDHVICYRTTRREEDVIARQRSKLSKGRSGGGGGGGSGGAGRSNRGPEPPQMQFGDVDFSDEDYSEGSGDSDA